MFIYSHFSVDTSRRKLLQNMWVAALITVAVGTVVDTDLDCPLLQMIGDAVVEPSLPIDTQTWPSEAENAALYVTESLADFKDSSLGQGADAASDFKDSLGEGAEYTSNGPSAVRPNFVIFFGDDWGWGDLGANWESSKGLTNNLDKLAENGVRFTDFHVAAALCTPSRAALLTGRIGLRTGVIAPLQQTALGGLPRSETTIAELLQANGYLTGMIGKWHLGSARGFHPSDRGFGSFLGVPYSIDMGCGAQAADGTHVYGPGKSYGCPGKDSFGLPVFKNHTIVQQPADLDNLSKMYDQEAHRFVSTAAASGKPFLLYFAASHVHIPQNHAPEWENRSQTPFATRANGGKYFAAALMEMDHSAGEILQALKTAGVEKQTLFLVTSDNGPWEAKCNFTGTPGPYQGLWQKQVGGGGSSSKATVWEGGHRVPGIMYWPSRIRPRVSPALVSAVDIFPTFAALAGIPLPTGKKYDGIDLHSVLFEGNDEGHFTLFHVDIKRHMIGAARNGNLKAVWVVGGEKGCGGPTPRLTVREKPLVFDLGWDSAERWPLTAAKRPDIDKIESMFNGMRDAYLHNIATDVRSKAWYNRGPAGKAANCCNPKNDDCACRASST